MLDEERETRHINLSNLGAGSKVLGSSIENRFNNYLCRQMFRYFQPFNILLQSSTDH